MDEFCGSPFWDNDLSWNTENSTVVPDLTRCFQTTVLVWIPCIFLWIFSIFNYTSCLRSAPSDSDQNHPGIIPWNVFNVSKIVICLVLIVTQLIRLGITLDFKLSGHLLYPADTYTPYLRACTYAFALASVIISKKTGSQSCSIQFTFWFLLVIFQLFRFRTTLLTVFDTNSKNQSEIDSLTLTIVLELIDYPLIVGQFLLYCWADLKIPSNNVDEEEECPEHSASPLSRLLFSWFDSLAWKGQRKSLEAKDIWGLNPDSKSSTLSALFNESWDRKLSSLKRNPRTPVTVGVFSVICNAFGWTFFVGSILKLIPDLLIFASPQVLNLLIAFMSSDEASWKGYFYATLLFLIALTSTLASAQYNHSMFVTAMRVKSALMSAIYRKSLVVSNSAKKESSTGEIMNLMSVDVVNITGAMPYINMLWSCPIQLALALYFLWNVLGPSILAGLGVLIILIPLNYGLGKFMQKYQVEQMKHKDERVKLIGEMLSGIKILKLYAWEPSFQREITKIRDKELKILRKQAYVTAISDFFWTCSQFVVAVTTFSTYVLVDEKNVLDAQKVFVSLSLMITMNFPVTAIIKVIIWAIQAGVSIGRLNKFLNAQEIDKSAISHNAAEVNPIVIENGYFSWDGNDNSESGDSEETLLVGERETNILKDINLEVKKGSLVAIVGPVGSGKSSLLSAILGEMVKTSGRVNTKGRISYVAQQAWIQNGTLRNNILFGKHFDQRQYAKVIDACALGPDLDIFPGKDQIEIGEKGINLSGGQKQRVSIARAVYNNSDVYLLDDPLSAVDSHVGKHIFEKVLSSNGLLRRKTRVLVTNSLQFLHQVDNIVVMKNGEISQIGAYEELMAQKGEFAELIHQYGNELGGEVEIDISESIKGQRIQSTGSETGKSGRLESSSEAVSGRSRIASEDVENPEQAEKLILEETMETAEVKWSIYLDYFRAAGWGSVFLSLALYVAYQAFVIGSSFWLAVWSNEPIVNGTQGNRDLYIGVYAGLGLAQCISFVVATAFICLSVIRAASVFHLNMLARILRAPMSFFDTTPTGRIVNRFSKDVDVTDNTLSFSIRSWINMFANVAGTLFIIIYSTPIFVVVIIPISIFYYFVQKFYIPTSRQLKRLESTTRSPIYSHFSETLNGVSTIRAYGEQQRFILESEARVDENQKFYYPSLVSLRWLAVRLEAAGSLIIFFAAVFAVLSRDTLSPGLVGLAISNALLITSTLSALVRSSCDLETNIVAVERLKEYGEVVQEAPWQSELRKPPKEWPSEGSIQFSNYQTRYREGLDLVLRNITCDVHPREKIGVVGRTGAGKSSLTLALFRIIEGVNEGSITVDGEDIRRLGLHDVRSRLTIIPQDPILFSGTLRFNLDPFVKYSDSAVWRALELSNLKTFVEGLQGQLQFKVSEGGGNLSVGQRQLACLARALLRKSKILVLDEATAAVDVETDELIQKTIRKEFKDCTVITIAHRLNTIMDSTRVMVMDNGVISEFDSPAKLLEDTKSQFYTMADDAGLVPSNAEVF